MSQTLRGCIWTHQSFYEFNLIQHLLKMLTSMDNAAIIITNYLLNQFYQCNIIVILNMRNYYTEYSQRK